MTGQRFTSVACSGNVVDLKGMAISTQLRTDAEEAAKKVKGVEGVHNDISYVRRTMIDDKIRVMADNAIYQLTVTHD